MKSEKQMERHLKGISNHYRIRILLLLEQKGSATLDEIVTSLKANTKTLAEHTRRLHIAGLLNKKYRGKFVDHSLSPYGEYFVKFLRNFQKLS